MFCVENYYLVPTTGNTFKEHAQRFVCGLPKIFFFAFKEIFRRHTPKKIQRCKLGSTVSKKDAEGNTTTVDSWFAREKDDVEKDLKLFLSDVISSCSKKNDNCAHGLISTLKCLDLDCIFSYLCGERLKSGKVFQSMRNLLSSLGKKSLKNSLPMSAR